MLLTCPDNIRSFMKINVVAGGGGCGSYHEKNTSISKSSFGNTITSDKFFISSGMSGRKKDEFLESIEESVHNNPLPASFFQKKMYQVMVWSNQASS